MNKRYPIICFAILILSLFTSCNWDVLTGELLEVSPGESWSTESSVLFTGEAPRNLRVSKAAYPDSITLSFGSVPNAQYYNIYRAEVPLSYEADGSYDQSLNWEIIGNIEGGSGKSIFYSDNFSEVDLEKITYETAYVYCVQAGNDYAELFLDYHPALSTVEKGWLLTPPTTISADQGVAIDSIAISWSSVPNVRGYNVEYSTDGGVNWKRINARRVPPTSSGTVTYIYTPQTTEYGKELNFRVTSVQSDSESEESVSRIGYTYVQGAPLAPEGVAASKADYSSQIEIEWNKSNNENGTDYTWVVTRMAPGEDEKEVLRFTTSSLSDNVVLNGEKYIFTDSSTDLKPNVVYEYTIKAFCEMILDGEDEQSLVPGPSRAVEGYLLSPPVDFDYSADYEAETMHITVHAPLGFSSDRNWTYRVEGQHNESLKELNVWTEIASGIPVEETVDFDFKYDASAGSGTITGTQGTTSYNEFRFYVVNGTGSENISDESAVIAPDEIRSNEVKIVSNAVPEDGTSANSSGVYPVSFTTTKEANGIRFHRTGGWP